MKWLAPNIVVDGRTFAGPARRPNSQADQDRYENDLLAIGGKIRQSAFGSRLLDLIGNNAQPILIAPTTNPNNAGAQAFHGADAFASGFQIPGPGGTVAGTGTGKGSMSLILFNPHGSFGGIGPDTTLLHEILHSYRQASGRWSPLPILPFVNPATVKNPASEAVSFEHWEEWFSVVAEDIYAAETGATSVRTTHNPSFWFYTAVKPAGSPKNFFHPDAKTDSEEFADKYGLAILRILSQEPQIYNMMKDSKAWFNPVKDYEEQMLSSRT